MAQFDLPQKEDTPQEAQEILTQLEDKFGFIPNVFLAMAGNTQTLKAYTQLDELYKSTSLTDAEKNLVFLAISIENGCHFCSAAHSTILRNNTDATDADIDAAKAQSDLPDEKLNALITFARTMTTKRGQVSESDYQAFLDAGYTKENVLDIILAISAKVLTNYSNAAFATPINEPFQGEAIESVKAA